MEIFVAGGTVKFDIRRRAIVSLACVRVRRWFQYVYELKPPTDTKTPIRYGKAESVSQGMGASLS